MEKKKTTTITRTIATAILFAFCANPICYAAYSNNVSEGKTGEIISDTTKTSVLKQEYTTKDGIHIKIEEVSNDKYKNLTPAQAAFSEYMQEYGGMTKEEADNYSKNTHKQTNNTKTTEDKNTEKWQPALTISRQKLTQMEAPYKSKNQKLLEAEDWLIAYKDISESYEGWDYENPDFIKIDLTDGDYVVWNPAWYTKTKVGLQGKKQVQYYAVEYHKDNSLMGIVKMKRIDKKTYAFYEYRIDSASNDFAKLKHVMTYYNDKHNAVFVYSIDGHIRALQYDSQNYLVDLQGVPEICQVDLTSLDNPKTAGNAAKQVAGKVGQVLIIPTAPLIMGVVFILAAYAQEKGTNK